MFFWVFTSKLSFSSLLIYSNIVKWKVITITSIDILSKVCNQLIQVVSPIYLPIKIHSKSQPTPHTQSLIFNIKNIISPRSLISLRFQKIRIRKVRRKRLLGCLIVKRLLKLDLIHRNSLKIPAELILFNRGSNG